MRFLFVLLLPYYCLSQDSTKYLSVDVATGRLDYRYNFMPDSYKKIETGKLSARIVMYRDSINVTEKGDKEFTWRLIIKSVSDSLDSQGRKYKKYDCVNQFKMEAIFAIYVGNTYDFYLIYRKDRILMHYREALKL